MTTLSLQAKKQYQLIKIDKKQKSIKMKKITTSFKPHGVIKSLSLAVASAICVLPGQLSAHGFTEFPKARQQFCEQQGGYWWPADGSAIPNAACRAAFLDSGHYQFTQKPEFAANVPDYTSQAAVESTVLDGTLCAGGDINKSGMNLPSADWQRSNITPDANGEITVRFRAETPHNPSFWRFYLTKPEFNTAVDVLKWSDLDEVQAHGNIPLSIDANGVRYYEMNVAIPAERSGDAILYTRWQRNDAGGEGFYNCSDITIKGSGTTDPQWTAAGFFVSQGQTAKVGDVVRARLFSETGQELINQALNITDSNLNNWQQALAEALALDNSQIIQIGVKNAADEVVFDALNLASNQVWVSNTNHTFNLSVKVQPDNTAPQVGAIADISMAEMSIADITVNAFDDENDALTFLWTVPAAFTLGGGDANISLVAPAVTADTAYDLSVTVSDGKLSTTQAFVVTVTNLAAAQWEAGKTYVKDDKVTYQGETYVAKWWTLGEQPNTAAVWAKL